MPELTILADGIPIRFEDKVNFVGGVATYNSAKGTVDVNIMTPSASEATYEADNFTFQGTDNAPQLVIESTPGAVNYWRLQGATAGVAPTFVLDGTDTNISGGFYAKGTGRYDFGNDAGTHLQILDEGSGQPINNNITVTGGQAATDPALGSTRGLNINIAASQTLLITVNGINQAAVRNIEGHASDQAYPVLAGGTTLARLQAEGAPTNIGMYIQTKGTGSAFLAGVGGTLFKADPNGVTSSLVNFVEVNPAITANSPVLKAQGSDTNITLSIFGKGTGGVSFSSATFMRVPVSAGAAPADDGLIAYNSTQEALQYGVNNLLSARVNGTVNVQVGGDTNDSSSGSTTDYNHSLVYALPAGLINAIGKRLRITVMWHIITGATGPNCFFKLKFGSTAIVAHTSYVTTGNNLAGHTYIIQYEVVTITTGATGTIHAGEVGTPRNVSNPAADLNTVTSPVTLDLTASQTVTFSSQWSAAGVGTNTIRQVMIDVELMN